MALLYAPLCVASVVPTAHHNGAILRFSPALLHYSTGRVKYQQAVKTYATTHPAGTA